VLCCAIGFGAVILIPVQYRHDGYHGREHLSEFLYRDVLRCYRVRENVRYTFKNNMLNVYMTSSTSV